MTPRVGVVLSGCGVFDGSEIHESVSILIALDHRGAKIVCMAPSGPQSGVVDHLSRTPMSEKRDVLREAARIARGKIVDIKDVKADELDALVFPGGFGAAKNLSDFAEKGKDSTVHSDVKRLILDMHAAGKPMGFACIAPAVAAKVLGAAGKKPKLTIGADAQTAAALTAMGAVHQNTGPIDVCVDEANRIVSTPCYMNDVGPWTVYQGADAMVEKLLRLTK